MNRIFALVLMSGLVLCTVTACDQKKTETSSSPAASTPAVAQKYTCTMHPEVVQDGPGKCPKCGMELVPKTNS
jgi:hypothetical protein